MKYAEGITAIEKAALQSVSPPAIPNHIRGGEESDLFHPLLSLGSFYITTSFELQLVPKRITFKKACI